MFTGLCLWSLPDSTVHTGGASFPALDLVGLHPRPKGTVDLGKLGRPIRLPGRPLCRTAVSPGPSPPAVSSACTLPRRRPRLPRCSGPEAPSPQSRRSPAVPAPSRPAAVPARTPSALRPAASARPVPGAARARREGAPRGTAAAPARRAHPPGPRRSPAPSWSCRRPGCRSGATQAL